MPWHEGETYHSVRLADRCGHCEACGVQHCPLWQDWQVTNEAALAETPLGSLTEYPDCPEEHECQECGGTGLALTPAGTSVLELVSRFRQAPRSLKP
jgi:hypothetical protein